MKQHTHLLARYLSRAFAAVENNHQQRPQEQDINENLARLAQRAWLTFATSKYHYLPRVPFNYNRPTATTLCPMATITSFCFQERVRELK